MTVQDAITRIAKFTEFDLDNFYGTSPTNEEIIELINWAQRQIGRAICVFNPSVTLTLQADAGDLSLRDLNRVSQKMWYVDRVWINGNPLRNAAGDEYNTWAYEELLDRYPSYQFEDSGTPFLACVYNQSRLILYQKPTSAVVNAGNNRASGFVLPIDRTDTIGDSNTGLDSQLDLIEELHEHVCYLAAFRAALPSASTDEAWKRLSAYDSASMQLVEEIRRENMNLITSGGSTSGMEVPWVSL